MIILNDEVSLIKEVIKSFSTITLLMIIRYIIIIITFTFVIIFVFEIIELRFSIYNKSSAFRMRKSYNT